MLCYDNIMWDLIRKTFHRKIRDVSVLFIKIIFLFNYVANYILFYISIELNLIVNIVGNYKF